MHPQSLTLEPAGATEREYVETLLREHDLPTADLGAALQFLAIAYLGDDRVGIGGVEPHGTDGLLRSVVVESDRQGEGIGAALCAALEDAARDDGIQTLYLLTTTAAPFFESQGYTEIPRSDASASVRESTEFEELCPSSATCMRKSL